MRQDKIHSCCFLILFRKNHHHLYSVFTAPSTMLWQSDIQHPRALIQMSGRYSAHTSYISCRESIRANKKVLVCSGSAKKGRNIGASLPSCFTTAKWSITSTIFVQKEFIHIYKVSCWCSVASRVVCLFLVVRI